VKLMLQVCDILFQGGEGCTATETRATLSSFWSFQHPARDFVVPSKPNTGKTSHIMKQLAKHGCHQGPSAKMSMNRQIDQ
jgi:hypothetical protein